MFGGAFAESATVATKNAPRSSLEHEADCSSAVPLILAFRLTQPVPSYGAADNGPAFPSSHTDDFPSRWERPKESPFKRPAMPHSHSRRLSEMTTERFTTLSCTVYTCIITHPGLTVKPHFNIFFTFRMHPCRLQPRRSARVRRMLRIWAYRPPAFFPPHSERHGSGASLLQRKS